MDKPEARSKNISPEVNDSNLLDLSIFDDANRLGQNLFDDSPIFESEQPEDSAKVGNDDIIFPDFSDFQSSLAPDNVSAEPSEDDFIEAGNSPRNENPIETDWGDTSLDWGQAENIVLPKTLEKKSGPIAGAIPETTLPPGMEQFFSMQSINPALTGAKLQKILNEANDLFSRGMRDRSKEILNQALSGYEEVLNIRPSESLAKKRINDIQLELRALERLSSSPAAAPRPNSAPPIGGEKKAHGLIADLQTSAEINFQIGVRSRDPEKIQRAIRCWERIIEKDPENNEARQGVEAAKQKLLGILNNQTRIEASEPVSRKSQAVPPINAPQATSGFRRNNSVRMSEPGLDNDRAGNRRPRVQKYDELGYSGSFQDWRDRTDRFTEMLEQVPSGGLANTLVIDFENENDFAKCFVDNVRGGGLNIFLDKPLAMGQILPLVLTIPGWGEPVCTIGKIVYLKKQSASLRQREGMVYCFQMLDVSASFLQIMKQTTDEYRSQEKKKKNAEKRKNEANELKEEESSESISLESQLDQIDQLGKGKKQEGKSGEKNRNQGMASNARPNNDDSAALAWDQALPGQTLATQPEMNSAAEPASLASNFSSKEFKFQKPAPVMLQTRRTESNPNVFMDFATPMLLKMGLLCLLIIVAGRLIDLALGASIRQIFLDWLSPIYAVVIVMGFIFLNRQVDLRVGTSEQLLRAFIGSLVICLPMALLQLTIRLLLLLVFRDPNAAGALPLEGVDRQIWQAGILGLTTYIRGLAALFTLCHFFHDKTV
jgi:tetratricopeptide (TPR) repeat protein